MNKKEKQARIAFYEAILGKIQGTRHAVKFISLMIGSLLKMRSSNLAVVANAMEAEAKTESSYKQIQRFLKSFRRRRSGFEEFLLELLGISGTLDLAIDRTEWKFGKVWINILAVSVVYGGVAIPVGWKVFSNKGNPSGKVHVIVLRYVIDKLGKRRIGKVFADREFCNKEMFKYLYDNEIDFCIRLKKNYLADGVSFKELCASQSKRVKMKAKRKLAVLGYPMAVSCEKLSESQYLIIGTKEVQSKAIAEYKKRWQIETMFGCLKSGGFDFEETHLTLRVRIERMMFLLALALCLAIKTGELKIKEKPLRKKNNGRYERSTFRIELDKLQHLLGNLHIASKWREFNNFS